jgi:hypothetical protein
MRLLCYTTQIIIGSTVYICTICHTYQQCIPAG